MSTTIKEIDFRQLRALTAILADAINDLDHFSVTNDDCINEEVASLFEISAKLFAKYQAVLNKIEANK